MGSLSFFIRLIIPPAPLFTSMKVPLTELEDRLKRFRARMDERQPGWNLTAIVGKIPLYYFTGTMQDGLLLITQDGDAVFWVRQSYERAVEESLFPAIRAMRSYRDVAAGTGKLPSSVRLETDLMSIAQLQRIQKHLPFTDIRPVDSEVSAVRAKKSAYELALMERAGKIHRHALEDLVPGMLTEGIDEATLTCDLYSVMVREGH
jgi:Xaa-Pro dipeptidase